MRGSDVMRREFLAVAFDPLSAEAAAERIASLADAASFAYVVTPNVDHIVQLHRAGSGLSKCYEASTLCLCDSRILSMLARWSGIDLPVVAGSDLTRDLLVRRLPAAKLAVIGGDGQLHADIATRFTHHQWHFYQPPMGVRHDPRARKAIADFVEAAGADVIFFAIGAPQSELVCAEILERGRARGVALCIGASLEFLTGAKRRAPVWMQRASLEWLHRLLSEPRRLWRRYLVDGPRIFAIWWRWRGLNRVRRRAPSDSSPSDFG